MFKKSRPLQSKSEIILRNIVVVAMVAFFIVFLIIPIGIAFAGSFHEWNPLSGTYKFLGLENYKQVFTSKLFGKSMFNTVIFSVVVIVFRVGLGLGIAYAIYSTLIKHKSFFRAVYYMPVVTPMVAVAFVWKFMYNPQIGIINKIFGLDINWLMNPKTALIAVIIMTIWKDFVQTAAVSSRGYRHIFLCGRAAPVPCPPERPRQDLPLPHLEFPGAVRFSAAVRCGHAGTP